MTESNSDFIDDNEDSCDPPAFIMTDKSMAILKSMEDILAELVNREDLYPDDDEFYFKFLNFLELYDNVQHMVIDASGIGIVCRAGCSNCCCHWVDDVNSFEGIIISRYLSENYPETIDSIIRSFRKDAEIMDSLHDIAAEKSAECSAFSDDIPDPYELLLACFYQLERPCALLGANGSCNIYKVRPITCRDYLNLRDPDACLPDMINEERKATFIMNLSDTVSQQMEILHRRFGHGNDDMSLRTLLPCSLEKGNIKG